MVRQCNVEYPQYELGLFVYKLHCMREKKRRKKAPSTLWMRFRDLHSFLVCFFCMVVTDFFFSFRAEFVFLVNKTTLFPFMFLSSSLSVFAFFNHSTVWVCLFFSLHEQFILCWPNFLVHFFCCLLFFSHHKQSVLKGIN